MRVGEHFSDVCASSQRFAFTGAMSTNDGVATYDNWVLAAIGTLNYTLISVSAVTEACPVELE